MPKRIGYFVPQFPSQTHAFFWREVAALRQMDVDVELVSTRRARSDECRHDFAPLAISQTYYLSPFGASSTYALLGRSKHLPRVARFLWHLSDTPAVQRTRYLGLIPYAADLAAWARLHSIDHLHIHSCATSALLGALCRLLGGPSYSLTLHGDLPVYGRDHASKMRDASFVSAVTRPLQLQVREVTGWPPERVPVITMGIDTEKFSDNKTTANSDGIFRIATVGRLNRAKGHRFILRAIALLKNRGYRLEYSIGGSGDYRSQIEQEIQSLGLTSEVKMLGSLGETDVIRLLENVEAFALASTGLGEAAPVAVMEAMAAGRVVICSRIGGTPDMIRHGVNGYLTEQQDVEGIADCLEELIVTPEKRSMIGAAARSTALADFDVRVTAQALLRAIEKWR